MRYNQVVQTVGLSHPNLHQIPSTLLIQSYIRMIIMATSRILSCKLSAVQVFSHKLEVYAISMIGCL